MKKVALVLGLFLFVTMLVVSCQKEENVANGAADFVGNYRTEDQCKNTSNSVYVVTIKENPSNPNQILVYNFYNYGVAKYVTADINGNDITVFPQVYSSTTVSGSGYLSGGNISLSYDVDDGSGIIDSCTANLIHQ